VRGRVGKRAVCGVRLLVKLGNGSRLQAVRLPTLWTVSITLDGTCHSLAAVPPIPIALKTAHPVVPLSRLANAPTALGLQDLMAPSGFSIGTGQSPFGAVWGRLGPFVGLGERQSAHSGPHNRTGRNCTVYEQKHPTRHRS
jgi:hypothetical protein